MLGERELHGIARRSTAMTVALAVLTLAFGVTAGVRTAQANQLSIQLNACYVSAIYEGAELMRGVESNLRKLTVSAYNGRIDLDCRMEEVKPWERQPFTPSKDNENPPF